MLFPWESGKKTQLDGSSILWGHTGTRATTYQHHTWRPTTSCLAQGQECTHCHILFSTHHNGRDQARASLWLCVKCPRDRWSLTIPPCIFLWVTELWVHSLWADLDHSQRCWHLPMCSGGTAMPVSHHRCFTNPILSHLSKLNYLIGQTWWKLLIIPFCDCVCELVIVVWSQLLHTTTCYNSDRFCVLERMHKS